MNIRSLIAVLLASGVFLASTTFAQANEKQFQEMMNKYLASDKGQEELGKTVETYFRKRQADAQKEQQQKAAADMEEQFKNPLKIDAGTSPAKGPADAKVTIIEFSDFQCPYCKRGKETMDELLKAYPNDVRVVFKNLPLSFHKEAVPSAKAALAAGKQGKFWEMHDALFNNQDKLGEELYVQKATELGLDMAKYKADVASPEIEKAIKDDAELAAKNGIQGTPGFFVNGVAVKGAYPPAHFKGIIDRWLSGSAANKGPEPQEVKKS